MGELKAGDRILVAAWWRGRDSIPCQIISVNSYDVIVQPLEGNPHSRYVKREDVLEKMPAVDWPSCPSTN